MRTPFIRLPVPISDPSAPLITGAGPVFPPPLETGALAHWQFGGDANCLRDLVGGHLLTPAGTLPTYDADHITIASGGLHGLVSTIADRKTWTAAFLFQLKRGVDGAIHSSVLLSQSTNVAEHGGSMLWVQRNSSNTRTSVAFQSRPSSNYEIGLSGAPDSFFNGLPVDTWAVLFAGRSEADGRFLCVPGSEARGGSADYREDDTPTTYSESARHFAIGNPYYQNTATPSDYKDGPSISEAIMWPTRLTQAQCLAAARRMVARAAYRGLTVAAVG